MVSGGLFAKGVHPPNLLTFHWGIEDPAAFIGTEEEKLEKFREVRDLNKGKET